MIAYCDLDKTLCHGEYEFAKPIKKNINKLNALYDKGWHIVIWTARGGEKFNGDMVRADMEYRTLTEGWLKTHEVKFHQLRFDKPSFDLIIDDKSENWSISLLDFWKKA